MLNQNRRHPTVLQRLCSSASGSFSIGWQYTNDQDPPPNRLAAGSRHGMLDAIGQVDVVLGRHENCVCTSINKRRGGGAEERERETVLE